MNRRAALQLLSVPFATSLARRATAAKSDRIVIAGAGIIGASIGYHLAKRGAQVTILEQTRPGAGATQNSFAWLNASKRPRPYYELNLMGIMGWRRLGLEIGPELRIQWGGVSRGQPTAATSSVNSFVSSRSGAIQSTRSTQPK